MNSIQIHDNNQMFNQKSICHNVNSNAKLFNHKAYKTYTGVKPEED